MCRDRTSNYARYWNVAFYDGHHQTNLGSIIHRGRVNQPERIDKMLKKRLNGYLDMRKEGFDFATTRAYKEISWDIRYVILKTKCWSQCKLANVYILPNCIFANSFSMNDLIMCTTIVRLVSSAGCFVKTKLSATKFAKHNGIIVKWLRWPDIRTPLGLQKKEMGLKIKLK